MDGILTMACYTGGLWIVGEKVNDYKTTRLKSAFFFVSGNNQIGLTPLHGGGKECDIDFGNPMISYPVQDTAVRDLYLEATTGIQAVHAPLADPGKLPPPSGMGKVLPFGSGPRK